MLKKYAVLLNADPNAGAGSGGDPGAAGTGGAANTVTIEERNRAIEKARKEEKDKLYPQIEALNNEKQTLTQEVTNLKTEVATLKGQLESVSKAKAADGTVVDLKKVIEEVAERTRQQTAAVYEQKLQVIDQEVSAVKSQHRKMTIEQYKAQKIAEAGGKDNLIPQLVRGETEAEIDASVQEAVEAYNTVKAKVGATSTPNNGNATKVPPAVPNGSPAAPGGTNPPSGAPQVRNLSMAEWKAQRDKVKAEIAQRYGQ